MGNHSFKTFTPPNSNRTYIIDAIQEVIEAYRSNTPTLSIDIPPRSGKSNIIYASSYELIATGQAPWALVISPWVFLKDQIVSADKVNSHIAMYGVKSPIAVSKIDDFSNSRFWNIKGSKAHIWSATLSLCKHQLKGLTDAVQETVEITGLKPLVYFDESQILGDDGEMGKVFDGLLAAGAILVTLTGTFYRRDRKLIKGAKVTKISENQNAKYKVKTRIDDKYVKQTDFTGTTAKYEMKPDFQVPWRTAFELGALCRINGLWVENDLNGKALSECEKQDIKPGALREILESPECVARYAQMIVKSLLEAKSYNRNTRNAAAMVVVGSDIADRYGEKETDRHAKQVKSAIEREASDVGTNLNIAIITMAQDSSSQDLQAFIEKEKFDVVIVKMMGLVGLDVPRLKVLAVMSTLRSGPMLGQMLTRNLTVWDAAEKLIPRTIMLEDPYMVDAYKTLIEGQGGVATKSMLEEESSTILADEVKPKPLNKIENFRIGGHIDNDGNALVGDKTIILDVIRDKYKPAKNLTDIDAYAIYESGGFTITAAEIEDFKTRDKAVVKAIKIDNKLDEKRTTLNEKVKKFVDSRVSYASRPNEWREANTAFWIKVKQHAGIVVPVKKERDISKFDKAIEYVEGFIDAYSTV